uniref:Nuclear transport factor 2 domain-containing protein n=1 Tax=Apteryx owenii TaxID=8824 RepID=A0A8B9QJ43_APTOW
MAEKTTWKQVGISFVHLYYQHFNVNIQLSALCYTDTTIFCFQKRLQFQKIQHSITSQDHPPASDNCILSMVVGQLKIDDDPVVGFHQLFALRNTKDNWM